MHAPIFCPKCREQPLEIRYVDHQHLACSHCGAEFCVQCFLVIKGVVAPSVNEYVRRERSAVFN